MRPFFDDSIAEWVAERIFDHNRGFGPCRAMGVERQGEIVAGIVFHNWEPETGVIEISACGETPFWSTRTVLAVALDYCFSGLNCQAVVARISERNSKALKFWDMLGAERYEIPRLRGKDEAEIIFLLTDDAWSVSKFKR